MSSFGYMTEYSNFYLPAYQDNEDLYRELREIIYPGDYKRLGNNVYANLKATSIAKLNINEVLSVNVKDKEQYLDLMVISPHMATDKGSYRITRELLKRAILRKTLTSADFVDCLLTEIKNATK
jgi:hypothetical protein